MDSDLDDLKAACEQLEKKLEEQKRLTLKVTVERDEIKQEYDKSIDQREELQKSLAETKDRAETLENVLEPAAAEFNDLHKRLEIEQDCRSEAEKYASKLRKQNMELKRQSQELMSRFQHLDIGLERLASASLEEEGELDEENERTALNKKIQTLETTVQDLEQKLVATEAEKLELSGQVKKLERDVKMLVDKQRDSQQELKNFRSVSWMACQEYDDLQKQLDSETALKYEAEKYAHDMMLERDALQHQLEVVMSSTSSHDQLDQALKTIAEMTAAHEKQRYDLSTEINTLKQTLVSCSNRDLIDELEAKLHIADEENTRLRSTLDDLESEKANLMKQNQDLQKQVSDFEQRLRPPTPPPVPPPPPPPVTFSPLKLIIKRQSVLPDTSKVKGTEAARNVNYEGALKEMMERIKSGQSLKAPSPRQASIISNFDAMSKLQKMLGGLKSHRQKDASQDPSQQENPVLKTNGTQPANELRQILRHRSKANLPA